MKYDSESNEIKYLDEKEHATEIDDTKRKKSH